MAELLQVLKDRSRGHVRGVMYETAGTSLAAQQSQARRRAGRWFLGRAAKQ